MPPPNATLPATSSIDRTVSPAQHIVGSFNIPPSTPQFNFPASSSVANSAALPTDDVIGNSSSSLSQHKLLYDQNEMYRVMSICQSLGKQMTTLLHDMGVSE